MEAAKQGRPLTREELGRMKLKAIQEYGIGLGMLKR